MHVGRRYTDVLLILTMLMLTKAMLTKGGWVAGLTMLVLTMPILTTRAWRERVGCECGAAAGQLRRGCTQ